MIRTIREAFNELLAENYWMDNETRAVAKSKADSMNERIGYPEFLKDPEELSMEYVMVSLHYFTRRHIQSDTFSFHLCNVTLIICNYTIVHSILNNS